MGTFQAAIIESELSHSKTIADALRNIDPDAKPLHFSSAKDFIDAYKKFANRSESSDAETESQDFSHLRLIIADINLTHNIDQTLWKKFLDFSKKLLEEEKAPVRLLYTSYDKDGEFDPRNYQSDVVFNILIKPLDSVIVQQTLALALDKEGPLKVDELYQQDKPAVVELIKDIEIERLTELGFRTKSYRPIDIRKIARYLGSPFEAGGTNSLFSYCYANYEVSTNPPQYSSSFSFFGISKEQLATIRRMIQADPKKEEYAFPSEEPQTQQEPVSVLLVSPDEAFAKNLEDFFAHKFEGIHFFWINSPGQLLDLLPPQDRKKLKDTPRKTIFDTDQEVVLEMTEDLNQVIALSLAEPSGKSAPTAHVDFVEQETFKPLKGNQNFTGPLNLPVQVEEQSLFLQVIAVHSSMDSDGRNCVLLNVRELTEEEHFQEVTKGKKIPKKVNGVFYHPDSFRPSIVSLTKNALTFFDQDQKFVAKHFAFATSPLVNYSDLEAYEGIDDLFQIPLDFFYLTRKLKMHFPHFALCQGEENSRFGMELRQGIKTALPLVIDSVSEVHISFKYPRAIRIGDVRRLILWIPNQTDMPEILAICRYCEKLSAESFRCDFLFFAVKDKQLKYIRLWMKQSYALEKQNN